MVRGYTLALAAVAAFCALQTLFLGSLPFWYEVPLDQVWVFELTATAFFAFGALSATSVWLRATGSKRARLATTVVSVLLLPWVPLGTLIGLCWLLWLRKVEAAV